ncbi:hypothetical protein NHX12_006147, partial [Muraenolepis orangiensis]
MTTPSLLYSSAWSQHCCPAAGDYSIPAPPPGASTAALQLVTTPSLLHRLEPALLPCSCAGSQHCCPAAGDYSIPAPPPGASTAALQLVTTPSLLHRLEPALLPCS